MMTLLSKVMRDNNRQDDWKHPLHLNRKNRQAILNNYLNHILPVAEHGDYNFMMDILMHGDIELSMEALHYWHKILGVKDETRVSP
jgi:hypothetical protein